MTRTGLWFLLGIGGLALGFQPAAAQLPDLPGLGPGWSDVFFPKVLYTTREGFLVGLRYAQVRPLGFADWEEPMPFRGQLSLDANITTSGSKNLTLDAKLPKLIDGWRFATTFEAVRRAREGYFGIGNDVAVSEANVTDAAPHFYQSDNRRYIARAEVQRRVVGQLRILAGVHLERWQIDTLEGPSQLAQDLGSASPPLAGRMVGEATARVGLVFDSRDDEVAPRRGVLLNGILGFADSSALGSVSTTRWTASAAGYLSIGERLVVAGRVLGQGMTGTPPIGSLYLIEASDEPFYGIGGPESHRAIERRRLLGADKLLANFDVRYDVVSLPTVASLTVVGFLDAGRVFPPSGFELTTADLSVGGGIGLVARIFRNGILGTTIATGPDGIVIHGLTAWTY